MGRGDSATHIVHQELSMIWPTSQEGRAQHHHALRWKQHTWDWAKLGLNTWASCTWLPLLTRLFLLHCRPTLRTYLWPCGAFAVSSWLWRENWSMIYRQLCTLCGHHTGRDCCEIRTTLRASLEGHLRRQITLGTEPPAVHFDHSFLEKRGPERSIQSDSGAVANGLAGWPGM